MDADTRQKVIGELARAIGLLAAGSDAEAAAVIRVLDRGFEAKRSLPGMEPAARKLSADAARKETAGELFRYWQAECGHQAAKLTPERVNAIMSRLREGYTGAEVRKAIDGAKHAPFISPEGKKFDDITLICRSGSKLEDFIQRGESATGAIVAETISEGGVEEKIASLRRAMVSLHREGRTTEYAAAGKELHGLMAKREAR
jgi:hypothetical protein